MKKIYVLLLFAAPFLLGNVGLAQTYSKTIKIQEDGDKSTVTITTEENGKSETVVLEGKDAQAYIDKNEKGKERKSISISKEDLKEFEKELESVTVKVEEMFDEIDEFEIDAAINELERAVEKTTKCLRAELEQAH